VLRLAIDAANLTRDRRGMGRFVRSVVNAALADPGIDLEFISLRASDDAALRAEFPGVAVRRAHVAGRRERYDAVWYPWNGVRFGAAAPSLVTIYDAFAFDEPARGWIARRRERAPIQRAARVATRVATISEWSRARIAARLHLAPERISVIRLAPDPFFFPGNDDAPPAAFAGKRYVLLVGAREARKNARTALAACALALNAPLELLAIAGSLNPADEQFARELRVPAGQIVSAGDELLRTLYRHAALVLVPSYGEGFGLVAVEALACGAPVLAANAAALPEATEGLATLLPPFDANAWAANIRGLLDDPARAAAQRARALERFQFSDRSLPARRTLDLLREIAGRTARRFGHERP
jgi:glycosyltransferase involved in cell wall biosynthesis